MSSSSPTNTIRVMVVDDSVVIRKLLKTVIEREADMEVVAVAQNGNIALRKMDQVAPDLITMDLDMPELDGLDTIRELRNRGLKTPVIMVSAATYQGAEQTLDCLNAGADDFILKPKQAKSFEESVRLIRVELLPKIRALQSVMFEEPVVEEKRVDVPLRTKDSEISKVSAIVVASSTGGPAALDCLFEHLGGSLDVPVYVVQHMPAEFTLNLARRLNEKHPLTFQEGTHGLYPQANNVYIAPGGFHMKLSQNVDGDLTLLNNTHPPENYCRPAADVLFRSAAGVYGNEILGIVLTGMGKDGANGSSVIVSCGGSVYVQDKASSVVWGMPGSVVEAGCASEVLSIEDIAAKVRHLLGKGRYV